MSVPFGTPCRTYFWLQITNTCKINIFIHLNVYILLYLFIFFIYYIFIYSYILFKRNQKMCVICLLINCFFFSVDVPGSAEKEEAPPPVRPSECGGGVGLAWGVRGTIGGWLRVGGGQVPLQPVVGVNIIIIIHFYFVHLIHSYK